MGNPHTPTSTYTKDPITTQPTNTRSSPPWYTAKALCDQESLAPELTFLTSVFKQNGYSQQQIHRAIKPATRTNKIENKPTCAAHLPYTQTSYGRLSRMLAKYNIKSVAIPPRKISSYIPPAKDAPGLRTPGIYRIP